MSHVRIIHDNAADRATLTASSQSGALGPANLLTEDRSQVLRSAGTALNITATWVAPELGGCVALPFCNLTPLARIRVRGYAQPGDSAALFDTGMVAACDYAPLGLWDWGALPLGVNAFSYGGGTYARVWFPITSFRVLLIELSDPDNPAGYLEAARLVVGSYWRPQNNVAYGAGLALIDTSTQYRTSAGQQNVDLGTQYRKLSLPLSNMTAMDRAGLWRIVRGNGLSRPLFASLFPDDDDPELEQAHQVYGRLANLAAITTPSFQSYATTIDIEEI